MSLKQWADNGWLRPHQTSPKEIKDLLAIVRRDLADANGDISPDWQFGIAYNAALTHDGAWTNDFANAAVFQDHSAAVAAKHQFHLDGETELYYSFGHPRQSQWDFTMNL